MSRYIKVGDLQRTIMIIGDEIRRCRNAKVKSRLIEEQAAYEITLRNAQQYKCVTNGDTIRFVKQ